jgi:hypothetical protein
MTFSETDENGVTNNAVEIYTVGSGWSYWIPRRRAAPFPMSELKNKHSNLRVLLRPKNMGPEHRPRCSTLPVIPGRALPSLILAPAGFYGFRREIYSVHSQRGGPLWLRAGDHSQNRQTATADLRDRHQLLGPHLRRGKEDWLERQSALSVVPTQILGQRTSRRSAAGYLSARECSYRLKVTS